VSGLTRQALLAGSPLAALAGHAGTQAPGLYRYRIGTFELTALCGAIL
jgi:hypothetical protein